MNIHKKVQTVLLVVAGLFLGFRMTVATHNHKSLRDVGVTIHKLKHQSDTTCCPMEYNRLQKLIFVNEVRRDSMEKAFNDYGPRERDEIPQDD